MPNNSQVFDLMNEVDPPVDFTGASADYYLQKYVDRPEHAGSIKGIQKMLSDIGTVFDPADIANSLLFAMQGDFPQFAENALYALPVVGNLKVIKKIQEGIEQRKWMKSYISVLKDQKKYGKFPKKDQFAYKMSDKGWVSEYEDYMENMRYVHKNYDKFAKSVGVDHSLWKYTKNKEKKLNKKTISQIEDMLIKLEDLIEIN